MKKKKKVWIIVLMVILLSVGSGYIYKEFYYYRPKIMGCSENNRDRITKILTKHNVKYKISEDGKSILLRERDTAVADVYIMMEESKDK
ncbi:MAG: hypothetical protein AB9856_10735 [Cellulosilyticaceae bacterium]